LPIAAVKHICGKCMAGPWLLLRMRKHNLALRGRGLPIAGGSTNVLFSDKLRFNAVRLTLGNSL
jgi:hypothetical protein